ncbi:MAG TPA: GDSL-type esterase/lipase family protein [Stellaceae bacterium]|jgi:lysophospholipase L1-like esterase|nr:GDSL-type esterase/lipase family protein [Stellaceae bacterium]
MSTSRRAALIGLAALLLVLHPGPRPVAAAPSCAAATPLDHLQAPLPHLAAKLAAGQAITIVAFGSSSTQGIGASTPDRAYPSRLQAELAAALPRAEIRVVNKGIGGEREAEMIRRFDRDVLAEHPDLVIWQVGANAVIDDDALRPDERLIRRGIERLQAAGIDVVLMDLQYAPEMLRHHDYPRMEGYIAAIGRELDVPVFRRFALMRYWIASGAFDMAGMVADDELHMNDASYGCLARKLADALLGDLARSSVVADNRKPGG